jgi:hypothetical protein
MLLKIEELTLDNHNLLVIDKSVFLSPPVLNNNKLGDLDIPFFLSVQI